MTSHPAPALAITGLTRTYGSPDGTRTGTGSTAVRALDGVDLALASGSFTAVMGPSGSGKSTLLSCAAGLETPDAGHVHLAGHELTGVREPRRTTLRRDLVGVVFQSFHLVPYLTVAENVGLPLRLAGRRVDRARVDELVGRVGLADRADHLPAQLSGGQQQRAAVARALVTRPAVLLADEPTGALDTVAARGVLGLLRDARDRHGQTVVLVTHDPVAAAYADEVVFLVDGRVAGRMVRPSVETVAAQMAHLDDLVAAVA